ncbi:MAG: histidine kinase [Alkalinema sp. CACIAM 70d]|nr:MAG: histidine kinase [Alkalinema sp. CACIAM 70d]
MQSTKQQQILGYFIEEAKEHLDTIEQGLLNLQATMADAEEMNQLFRAAHSVKGGAAMLGFDSIQKISHHLEDYFKILKENPVKIDRKLEDHFLKGFDALKALIEALQSPFGLRPEDADRALRDSAPAFAALGKHLNGLIQSEAASAPASTLPANAVAQVNNILKLMLQLFKQGDTPKGRQQLMTLCVKLAQLDKTSQPWVLTVQTAQRAIANPNASFAHLAPLIIKELKQASDLLLTGRASEILPSHALQKFVGAGQAAAPAVKAAPAPATTLAPAPATVAPNVSSNGVSGNGASNGAGAAAAGVRQRQISIPADPKGAARALLDQFNKGELIQIAEFLMKAIQ